MAYMIIGGILAVLEVYRWLTPRSAVSFAMPLAFRVAIPILIGLAAFRRPNAERPAIIVMAATFAASLARDVFGPSLVLRLAVLCGTGFLMWSGYTLRPGRASPSHRRLLVAFILVVVGFLLFWLLPLL
jgi:hypothetical protein